MLQIKFNDYDEPKIELGEDYKLLRLFLQDDLPGLESCNFYLEACAAAASGIEQDLSGNSCGVSITSEGVTIEHMFMDDLPVTVVALEDFSRLIEWKRRSV